MHLRGILQGFLVGVVIQLATPAIVSAQDVGAKVAQTEIGLDDVSDDASANDKTGEIRAAAWYTSDEGPSLSFGFKNKGAFGPDTNLELGANVSRYSRGLNGHLTMDHAFGTNLTQEIMANGYAVQGRPTLGQNFKYSGYDLATMFTRHTDNDASFSAGFGAQGIMIDPASAMPLAVSDAVAKYGQDQRGGYVLMQTALDRSNSAADRGGGYRLSASAEFGTFATARYTKITLAADVSHQVGPKTTLNARAKIGRGFSVNGDDFPLFENFTAGGVSDLRGFAAGGIGPVSPLGANAYNAHIGGNTALTGGVEMSHALGQNETLALIAFVDAGTVNATGSLFDDMRSAAGIGLRWDSPIGPMDISYAKPIASKATDVTENLQISFGLRF